MTEQLMILVAGPYRGGTNDDPVLIQRNVEAMEDLTKNQGVIAQPLPDEVVKALRVATTKILDEAVAKDPVTKKVHDSYFAYKAKYDAWADQSELIYHTKIRKA